MPTPTDQSNQRDQAASDERQEEVVRRYLTGSSMREVARQMGISVMTVARDLQRARETWKTETAKTYDELLPEKLAQLEAIRSAAWEGWKRSLKAAKRHTKTTTTHTDGFSDSTSDMTERSTGDPRYLVQLERCLRLECQLRGMLDKDAGSSGETVSEVVEIVITTREEHEEFKSLSMEEFRKRAGKVG
jgi:transposase-like protein